MTRSVFFRVCLLIFVALPAWAQETLYPVPGTGRVEKNPYAEDRYYFVVEKPFEYKLTLGFPTDEQAQFMRDTKSRLVVLWLRLENLSRQALKLTTEKFAATDSAGQSYARLTGAEAFDRIIAGKGLTGKAVTKGIRSVTLGRASSKSAEEDARDEAVRFSLQSTAVPPLGVKQGLIYFEGPAEKAFTINVDLADLWTKPFAFTNVKPKTKLND